MQPVRYMGVIALALSMSSAGAQSNSNIDVNNRHAWGENIGWTNWQHDAPNPGGGVIIHDTFLSGFVWAENVGWINLGDGDPGAQGDSEQAYANTDGADFGVNILCNGDLDGYAWGENIGWINFGWSASTNVQRPRIDLVGPQGPVHSRITGYAWGENIGWINLSLTNETQYVEANVPTIARDCNGNNVLDACDIDSTDPDGNGLTSEDCNGNSIPDECDLNSTWVLLIEDFNGAFPPNNWSTTGLWHAISADCNSNGIPDECDITDMTSEDCDDNGIPDECDVDPTDPDGNGAVSLDCNGNGIPDDCDLDSDDPDGNGEISSDINGNDIPDECEVPPNDDCNNATVIFEGMTQFSTLFASDDEIIDDACGFGANNEIGQDIWYLYTASDSGLLTISTCNPPADFDTRIAVYEGNTCPINDDPRLIDCADDPDPPVCGDNAYLTIPVLEGKDYLIRLGGEPGANGAGTLNLTFGSLPACPPSGVDKVRTYSITGDGTGVPWSWCIKSMEFLDACGTVLGGNGTNADIAAEFAMEINNYFNAQMCDTATFSAMANEFPLAPGILSIAIDSAPDFQLWVGGGPVPDCLVTGQTICELNPTIELLALPGQDCNENGVDDVIDVLFGYSMDVIPPSGDGFPDECQADCNGNLIPDSVDITGGTSQDCNSNQVPDECEIPPIGSDPDCNNNSIPDVCEVPPIGTELDCNSNGVPDECEASTDCNNNGILDVCETDCNRNNIPDDCDISSGNSQDGDMNGVPDECQCSTCSGDLNGSWAVDFADVDEFVATLINDSLNPCADANGDGSIDSRDIQPFVALAGTACPGAPTGACCSVDMPCSEDTQFNCRGAGGSYLGDGTTCTPSPCPGACCFPGGGCSIEQNESTCTAENGIFQGPGTSCTPNPCQ
ncbi:MAG: hypothetical protein MI923_08360 [Phycisphaerales bacterium]|nr:hypothetical protein [Phycisphaerales bacterium]